MYSDKCIYGRQVISFQMFKNQNICVARSSQYSKVFRISNQGIFAAGRRLQCLKVVWSLILRNLHIGASRRIQWSKVIRLGHFCWKIALNSQKYHLCCKMIDPCLDLIRQKSWHLLCSKVVVLWHWRKKVGDKSISLKLNLFMTIMFVSHMYDKAVLELDPS